MAAGAYHTCALVNGGVQCWGDNSLGQLGNGSTDTTLVPVHVQGLESGVTAIAAGASHTCAVAGNGLQCWGMGNKGQLGNGTTTFSSPVPVVVSGIASAPTALAGGLAHTCAVVNGAALCWGNNEDGALGDGVRCWGYSMDGTLGDGTTTGQLTPVPVLGLESGVSALAGAGSHTCVVMSSGSMKCWGQPGFGELGDGSLMTRTSPTQVVGLTSGVTSIGLGTNNTCARAGGILKCWGQNFFGQIGDGTTTDRAVPTQVLLP
jgi:alpha-tubulin suppressor-like RCC1 family protein